MIRLDRDSAGHGASREPVSGSADLRCGRFRLAEGAGGCHGGIMNGVTHGGVMPGGTVARTCRDRSPRPLPLARGRASERGPADRADVPAHSGHDARQGSEKTAAAKFVAKLGGQAVTLLPPQPAQMAEQHQGTQRNRQADQQLQAELQHGGGEGSPTRAEDASLGAACGSCSADHALSRFRGA